MRSGLRSASSIPPGLRICQRTFARRSTASPVTAARATDRKRAQKASVKAAPSALAVPPRSASNYADLGYWDRRYTDLQKDESFDWYQSWSLKPMLAPLIKPTDRIMVVGCGNSKLSHDLVADGYTNIVSIDYSRVIIEEMQKRHPDMEWVVADATSLLGFSSETVDVALDKGTLDAMLCGPGSSGRASAMLGAVARVLRPSGLLVEVTHSPFSMRQSYFQGLPYQIEEKKTISKENSSDYHYVFLCRKIPKA